MKTIQHDLHLRYEAYTRAHQRFAERGEFRVEIYQGRLEIDNQHDIKHLATSSFSQEMVEESAVIPASIPAVQDTALPLFKALFNTNFVKAIKLLFY
ncbi:conserved hypothetical protein [Alteromonas sp. 38]|uniref:hypothetical protein n=1 Tax=Alteromonas TaxID=226 RepID=UPI0012F2483A|nr:MULTISPECIES: hypothetical protein [Alteromonas]CAD5264286.1 conserved hypothetical protein [Alteromonas sp. 154]VXC16433.1 conserved hypothetical protein [Alteromonas sp. 38]